MQKNKGLSFSIHRKYDFCPTSLFPILKPRYGGGWKQNERILSREKGVLMGAEWYLGIEVGNMTTTSFGVVLLDFLKTENQILQVHHW